jgi:hypothetical protein
MSSFGPDQAMGLIALMAGLAIVAAAMYARRSNRLNTRHGAEVLAGLAAVMGIVSMAAGAVWLVQTS